VVFFEGRWDNASAIAFDHAENAMSKVAYYEAAGGYQRGFCCECGSPILNPRAPNSKRAAQSSNSLSQYGIPLAILDDPLVRPGATSL
jgi:hypothetical protein